MPLTNVEIQNADATDKAIKLFDGRGLYLEVSPRGGRWWRLKYRFQGREKRLALGVYPEVSLKEARARCDEARKQILDGKDPALLRRLEKERLNGPTFETVAREWHEKRRHSWKPEYAELVLHRLVANAFPWLGERRLADISPRELLVVLRRIEARGAVETAHRILQYTGQILRYGIATGRAERDITSDLRGALRSVKERHHASLTDPNEVGALFSAIQAMG
jgi:Arm DNA-binding domain